MSHACRVILLLDLDCFYAQCERVRLGLDAETCSLALLQWNSVLAVTYPARKFGIQRGDSWKAVAQKSKGICIALHLPLLEKDAVNTNDHKEEEVEDITTLYNQVYQLSSEERQRILREEEGKQRFHHEGKACLERYRLASARIFGVVGETLEQLLGKGNFVLERASIDELFLDVTEHCNGSTSQEVPTNATLTLDAAVKQTVKVGHDAETEITDDNDPAIVQALHRGCWVAKAIRQAVVDTLGFTLSAGISTSKLVAKLGASHGKPNGQAVILPSAIDHVMNQTPLRKVRNMGGKIGKQVQALLPPDATMGDVARLLSLPQLTQALGAETAQRVFDNSRGIDHEEVKETAGALVKSITAFKSFGPTKLDDGVQTWLQLLAKEILQRVQHDSQRNERYPKSCTVHYATERSTRQSKSIRVAFPREQEADKMQLLVTRATQAIQSKEGTSAALHRVGLCAMEFESRVSKGGIASFFDKSNNDKSSTDTGNDNRIDANTQSRSGLATVTEAPTVIDTKDADLEIARKLQATYDREDAMFAKMEQKTRSNKRMRIDTFFRSNKS